MDLTKIAAVTIGLVFNTASVLCFAPIQLPSHKFGDEIKFNIPAHDKAMKMKMSISFRNKLNYSSVGFSGLRYASVTEQRSCFPSSRWPLHCTNKCATFSSLSKRDLHASTSCLRVERNSRAVLSNRGSHLNQSMNDRGGDVKKEEDGEIGFSWESFDKKGAWRTVDWNKVNIGDYTHADDNYIISQIDQLCTKIQPDKPSPVELCLVRDRMVYIKRDDLLRLPDSGVSGNKARKMLALNYLPIEDFPDVVVSYGGVQSNAMLAIAAIVNAKNIEASSSSSSSSMEDNGSITNDNKKVEDFVRDQAKIKRKKRFVYYAKKLPRYLRNQPSGNILRALSLGMEIVEVSNDEYKELFGGDSGGASAPPPGLVPPIPGNSVWIPQGGACGLAVKGVCLLADEIVSFWDIQGKGNALSVCVPGGTCTTAMLLSREINAIMERRKDKLDIQVVVIPCVGGDKYAYRQMSALDITTGGNGKSDLPAILLPLHDADYGPVRRKNNGYFTFGEPASAILDIFEEMKEEHGVNLDLLYGAPAWTLLLQHWKWRSNEDKQASPIDGRQIMYVHTGGLEGIASQMTRYKHKGLIDDSQIQ